MKNKFLLFFFLSFIMSTLTFGSPNFNHTAPSKLIPGRIKFKVKKCYLRLYNTEENVFDIKRMKGAHDTQSYLKKLGAAQKCDDGFILGQLLIDGKYGAGQKFFGYSWDRQQLRIDFDLGISRSVGAVCFHMRDSILVPTGAAHTIFVLFSDTLDFKSYTVRGPFWGARHIIRKGDYNTSRDKGLWRKHYFTFMLEDLNVKARYVRIITDSMNFRSDEIEVLLAKKSSAMMATPTEEKGPYFCPYYPRRSAEVLDAITPISFLNKLKLWDGGDSWLLKPVLEVPEGIEFIKGLGYDFTKENIQINGKPYIRYNFTFLKNYAIYWKTNLPEGYIGPMWIINKRYNNSYRQKVEVYSKKLPACPLSNKLLIREQMHNLLRYLNWPDFLNNAWKLGFTSIALSKTSKASGKQLEKFINFKRESMISGYNIQWACNTFLKDAIAFMKKNPGVRHAVMPDGRKVIYPCPFEIIEKMENVLLNHFKEPGSLGIEYYQLDWESEYGRVGCVCPVCCERFKKFCQKKYPKLKNIDAFSFIQKKKEQTRKKRKEFETAWWDYNTDIGVKIWNKVRRGAIISGESVGKKIIPQFAFYAVPFCRYPYIGPYKLALKKGITDIPEPCNYNPNPYAYEWGFGLKDWTNKTIAYPGIAGPLFYGANMIYNISIEVFAAGIAGATWFPSERIFGRSFVELADATRQGALVDDIIEHGQIFPELLARRRWARSFNRIPPEMIGTIPPFTKNGIYASDGTRVIGCQHNKNIDEKLVVATKYYIKTPQSFTIHIPVKKKSIVINLYNRTQIATLIPKDKLDFPCTLIPFKHEARMFLVVPEEAAWKYSKPLLGLHKKTGDRIAKNEIRWFAPAVSATKFILEFSKIKNMKNSVTIELSPASVKGAKDGLYMYKLNKKLLANICKTSFFWRVGAINQYTSKIIFARTIKVFGKVIESKSEMSKNIVNKFQINDMQIELKPCNPKNLENILDNYNMSFELGLKRWRHSTKGNEAAKTSIKISAQAHSGQKSLFVKMSGKPNASVYQVISRELGRNIHRNKKYIVTAWMRSSQDFPGKHGFGFGTTWYGEGWKPIKGYPNVLSLSRLTSTNGKWIKLVSKPAIIPNAAKVLVISAGLHYTKGQCWIDDLGLYNANAEFILKSNGNNLKTIRITNKIGDKILTKVIKNKNKKDFSLTFNVPYPYSCQVDIECADGSRKIIRHFEK